MLWIFMESGGDEIKSKQASKKDRTLLYPKRLTYLLKSAGWSPPCPWIPTALHWYKKLFRCNVNKNTRPAQKLDFLLDLISFLLWRMNSINFYNIPWQLLDLEILGLVFTIRFDWKHSSKIWQNITWVKLNYILQVGIFFLIHLFAWDFLLLKNLEIEETKTT